MGNFFSLKPFFAICLALILVFSSISIGWAEGPGDNHTSSGPTDGGDGHPWDDGTTEESQPGEDDEDGLNGGEPGTTPPVPVVTMRRGFSGWLQGALTLIWRRMVETETSQTVRGKTSLKRGYRRYF